MINGEHRIGIFDKNVERFQTPIWLKLEFSTPFSTTLVFFISYWKIADTMRRKSNWMNHCFIFHKFPLPEMWQWIIFVQSLCLLQSKYMRSYSYKFIPNKTCKPSVQDIKLKSVLINSGYFICTWTMDICVWHRRI